MLMIIHEKSMQKQYANADRVQKYKHHTKGGTYCSLLRGSLKYLILIGQLQHSAVNYFCIISPKLCN